MDSTFSSEAKRCFKLQNLIKNSLPHSKLSAPAKLTLLRLLRSEIRFLLHLPSLSNSTNSNIGFFESIVRILLHPALRNASRICKPVPSCSAQIDIVCTFESSPAWFIVSDRNPNRLKWIGTLRARADRALLAARSAPVSLRPSSFFLVFARGIPDDAALEICLHLGAVEVGDSESWGMEGSRWFEIRIDGDGGGFVDGGRVFGSLRGGEDLDLGRDAFGDLVSCLGIWDVSMVDLVNFDTTALIAIVSGISNGDAERLIRAPEGELIERFKGNCKFVLAQATSELEKPILIELKVVLEGKKGIICESVLSEFKELISMYGGANEKLRADQLLKHLFVVPDSPSARISSLATTRKIALKNKVIFGTGDHHRAPTLTANMGFVRAIHQTGLSLLTLEHNPRALTGD